MIMHQNKLTMDFKVCTGGEDEEGEQGESEGGEGARGVGEGEKTIEH